MCDQDIEAARRARDLERYHRRTAERRAKGLCLKCGKRPPAPHRSQCEPCIEKRRPADLARYHRRTAERIAEGLWRLGLARGGPSSFELGLKATRTESVNDAAPEHAIRLELRSRF